METEVKNRAWVKDAAIIFLAILLVLTFFSQTIMNRSLVEVATQEVKEGPITAKVRGKGTVAANGSNKVKAAGTVTINKVMVKNGDKVKAGDILFVLGAGDSNELETAKEALFDLENSYTQALASLPIGGNYAGQQNDIEKKRKDMIEAEREMNLLADTYQIDKDDSPTVEQYEQISGQGLQELVNIENECLRQVQEKMGQRDELQNQIDYWKKVNEESEAYYKTLNPSEDPEIDKQEAVAIAKQAWLDAANSLSNVNTSEVNNIINNLNSEINVLNIKLEAVKSQINNIKLTQATETEANLQKYLEAKRAYEDAVGDYNTAIASLQHSAAVDGQSQNVAYLSAQAIAAKIERQKEKIKELAGEGDNNVITAKTSGIITEIGCAAGDKVIKDDILAVIEVPDMGYTISFSVTNDQARRLKVGDTAQISNFYWGNSITAKLKSIVTDKKNPQTQKTLTFDLEGEVTAGSELTVSVGQKSANYDLVVPNSAIKNDNNGSFVYVIEAKNSPLGNRYIAKRVKVEVLVSDDTNSAVTADLKARDFVITTTAAPIKNGDQVRLADSTN